MYWNSLGFMLITYIIVFKIWLIHLRFKYVYYMLGWVFIVLCGPVRARVSRVPIFRCPSSLLPALPPLGLSQAQRDGVGWPRGRGGWLLLSLVVCSAGNAISVPVTVHHGFPVLCDFFFVIKFWLHFGSNNFVIVVVWITFVYQRA